MLREEIYRLSLISYGRKMTQNEVCYKTTGVLVIWRSQIAARVGHQSPSGLSANATEPSQLGSVWDGLGGGLHLAGRPFFGKCYPGGRKLAVSFSMTPPPPLGAFQVWPMTQTQTVRRPAIWPLSADFRTRVSEHAGQPQTQQTQGGGGQAKNPVPSKGCSLDHRGQTWLFVQAHKDPTEIISTPLLVPLPWLCVLNRT